MNIFYKTILVFFFTTANILICHFYQGGILGSSIGVIAPFRAQVTLLKNTIYPVDPDIEVNTVDQYQGRDKEVIIYSCTKNTFSKVLKIKIVLLFV